MLLTLNKTQYVKNKFEPDEQHKLRMYQLPCSVCCYIASEKAPKHPGKTRRKKTGLYCNACSDVENGHFVCFCDPKTGRDCFINHINEVHNRDSNERFIVS